MKVLIVSIPRAGSTSLMNNISQEKGLTPIFEPFNIRQESKDIYNSNLDNIVLKTIVGQYENSTNLLSAESMNDWIEWEEWIVDFSKKFDEVILLSRKNLIAAAESFSVASWYDYSWTSKYKYEKLPNLQNSKNYINYVSKCIDKLSTRLNIPITYYEDIFDENSKDRLRQTEFVIEKDKLF